MFKYYDCLGSRSYYQCCDKPDVYTSFSECVTSRKGIVSHIDATAVLGILMKNYAIGDRTLVKGIKRTPWMSRQLDTGEWKDAELPIHGKSHASPEEAALQLHQRLRSEVLGFISDKSTIGILLSGGMDSRIVAGIVRLLQTSGEYAGNVVALTWGVPSSRDVVYAQRISDEFGWDFKHFELNAEVLKRNIELSAIRGAEYSPVHLHAMEAISNVKGVDGILAGSYGDSIGRGEYSGRRTNKLPAILDKHLNQFSFLIQSVERDALYYLKQDLAQSRKRFPGREEMAYREIEMQMHYMRRQLNSCMEVIDDRIPLYQVFSSPHTFGYMWSLGAQCRTDNVYESLLNSLPSILRSIPWARTGKKYNQNSSVVEDNNSALNNCYGLWLRTELRDNVLELVQRGALQSLGIFNESALNMWSKYWPTGNCPKADRLDEKMAWLASLALFVEKYNVSPTQPTPAKCTYEDSLSQAKAFFHTKLYHQALKWKGR